MADDKTAPETAGKTYLTQGAREPETQIGDAMAALAATIERRRSAGEQSYTYRLLTGDVDKLLKKVVEEAHETTLAVKDALRPDASGRDVDHVRYEAGDVIYHLLVLLARCGVSIDELAAELNTRMTEDEIERRGRVVMLKPEYVNRGR